MRVVGADDHTKWVLSLLSRFARLSYAHAMLPILRILPVGGVLLAIVLLALALSPPDGSRAQLRSNLAPVRGAMIERSEHPEWRQFLMLAAIQRADELNRLRELPDTPARTDAAPAAPKVADLPTERSDTDLEVDDETGSTVQPPAATIPIDIGESSSVELPVAAPEEKPPVVRLVKSHNKSRIRGARHVRRARGPAKPDPTVSFNLFDLLFGSGPTTQPPTVVTPHRHRRSAPKVTSAARAQ
jgi:hypothetical protein